MYYSNLQSQKAFQNALYAYIRQNPMNCILEPQNQCGGLYLGNLEAAQNVEYLKKHNINAVLTVAARSGIQYNK